MSATRIYRPQALRLYLSKRWHVLRRSESTAAQSNAGSPSTAPPRSGFLKRYRAPILWSTISLTLGLVAGNMVLYTISPPALPETGSHEDAVLMADLNKRIDEEFKVQVLRGKCLGVARQLKGVAGGWVEIVPRPTDAPAAGHAAETGFTSILQGAKGLGVERTFWNRDEQRLVAVIWFGGSVSGWPGVTHGGVIATQLADKLALAAALSQPHASNVSAAAVPQRMPGTGNHAKMFAPAARATEPEQLSLSYVKPTYANGFYVIRVAPALPLDQGPEHIVPEEPAGADEFEATLEAMDTKVNVKARARFTSRKTSTERAEEKISEGAVKGYQQFREWLWPSRQRNSQIE